MSRHRTVVTLLFLAGVLAVMLPIVSGAQEKPKKGLERSVEYKLRLAPEMLQPGKLAALWTLIGVQDWKLTPKKCRLIRFLDVDGDYLAGTGYIVRHRLKLGTEACPESVPATMKDGDVTLKFRTRNAARVEEESRADWMQDGAGEPKLEKDVGLARGGEGSLQLTRTHSASAKLDTKDVPDTVARLREGFPNSLLPLVGSTPLGAGCHRVLEESWELAAVQTPAPDTSGLPDGFDLVAWYAVAKDDKKSGSPSVVELSFKAKDDDGEAANDAHALFIRIIETVDPAWLAPGGSKTEAAAACANE
ncbi:MAG: hypothetical protein ABIR79_16465 [Candidatus Binatia bacterium]